MPVTSCPLAPQTYAAGSARVQFWAYCNWVWHDLGVDTNGADGWSTTWDWSLASNQHALLSSWVQDARNTLTMNPGGTVTITLTAQTLSSNVQLSWSVPDHLGGQHLMVDAATGAVVSTVRTWPFGETRAQTGSSPTDRRYTGQTLDTSTGLYYYGARYYSGALGRFVQPDTIVPDPTNPQTLNRFAYANNNPLTLNDPTGHNPGEWLTAAGDFAQGVAHAAGDALTVNGTATAREVAGVQTPDSAAYYAGRLVGDVVAEVQGVATMAAGIGTTGVGVATSPTGVGVLVAGAGLAETAYGAVEAYTAAGNFGQDYYKFFAKVEGGRQGGATGLAKKPIQGHHFITNKNRKFTHQMEEITNKYGLDLDDDWNIASLPHQGRHADKYHQWVLDQLKAADKLANGDKTRFLQHFNEHVVDVVNANPSLFTKAGWE